MGDKPDVLNLSEYDNEIKEAMDIAERLQDIGSKCGFNAFQPGTMKEIKMADLLGHCIVRGKKNADACDCENLDLYEYLSAKEGGAGQIDRVFKDGEDEEQHKKYLRSMERIERNKAFYIAYTNPDTSMPLDILRIYEMDPKVIREEADRQLQNSSNDISHVSFHEKFAKEKGTLVWEKEKENESDNK